LGGYSKFISRYLAGYLPISGYFLRDIAKGAALGRSGRILCHIRPAAYTMSLYLHEKGSDFLREVNLSVVQTSAAGKVGWPPNLAALNLFYRLPISLIPPWLFYLPITIWVIVSGSIIV